MKLWDRIFGTDEEIELASRRAFLVRATVTAAGLVLPLPTIFIPAVPQGRTFAVNTWPTPIRYSSDPYALRIIVPGKMLEDPRYKEAILMARTLREALDKAPDGSTIVAMPGYSERADLSTWEKLSARNMMVLGTPNGR